MRFLFYNSFLFMLMLGMVFPATAVNAITNDFTIRTFIGEDNTPPTIPTGLTAIPVSTSQIDLAWLPSTDDFELTGYHVWRDSVLIATTTSLVYVDTGLTASTTYAYSVSAYDHFFNESATSTTVATTTLSIPVVPPPQSPSRYGFRLTPFDNIITSLQIFPQKDSVTIRYETNMYIQSVIRWGKTISYELGSLAEQVLSKKHETRISGLTPGTKYQFTIEGKDKFGREGTLHSGTFTTLPPDDIFPPGNVTQLTATRDGTDVVLSWKLPEDPDLSHVRVVRSDRFYPSDIADGWVVYEGLASGFRDADAAVGMYQFYTVFSYDTLGNISSGAVVRVRIDPKSSTTIPVTGTIPSMTVSSTPTTTELGKPNPTRNAITLSFSDIRFIQEGIELPTLNGRVEIDGAKQLIIALPYTRVPEHLKTILVVLGDSTNPDRSFQFLLRANAERTAYTSTLAPFGVSGTFPVSVSVFDFSTAQIGYANGSIDARIAVTYVQNVDSGGFAHYLISFVTSYIFWFVLLIILLMFVGRRLLHREA